MDRKKNRRNGNDRYRPKYHASVPSGWANDPNGLIWFDGKAHLFFQHNPYAPKWGRMYWGHMVSEDMVRWSEEAVALKPDKWYDRIGGCFSGTALAEKNRMYLMYTGAGLFRQRQCLAESEDGIVFHKYAKNPVITAKQMPGKASKRDCRDPRIFCRNNQYYCMVGAVYDGKGDILLFRSEDKKRWTYIGNLMRNCENKVLRAAKGVFECPDYQMIDGQEILIACPLGLDRKISGFENEQTAVWMAGAENFKTGEYTLSHMEQLDFGFDFYAPQMMRLEDGRTILIGWMNGWNRTYPTQPDGWVGSFTLPRELVYEDGHLHQLPVQEITNYRRGCQKLENVEIASGSETDLPMFSGNCTELLVKLDVGDTERLGIKLLKGEGQETLLYYDRGKSSIVLDRSKSGTVIKERGKEQIVRECRIPVEKEVSLHIFPDISCLEVFINKGYAVMSANVYGNIDGCKGISLFATGGKGRAVYLEKYEIEV